MGFSHQVVIEDGNGDRGIRIPDKALQELGLNDGDSLCLFADYVGTKRCMVLTKRPFAPGVAASDGFRGKVL
jgi:F420-0:gamma-glutamyl ligase-like protein|tara:strand:- start:423 stop:638 length:216 start_codon:yes stop_codon:yes gene_type:complete